MNVGLQVLLEDEHCLAVVKPAGQFVQGTWAPPGEQTLEQAVRAHLDPGESWLGLPGDRPPPGPTGLRRLDLGQDGKSGPAPLRSVRAAQGVKEYWAIVKQTGESPARDNSQRTSKEPGPTG